MIAALRRRLAVGDDRGSILPLTIGYAILALAVVLVCVDATSLYLAQKRLDSLADAAALAGADGFMLTVDDGEPRAELDSAGVHTQAQAFLSDAGGEARLVSADSPDGRSARVRVAATWHPPILTVFVPDGVDLAATATGRTALG
jgi:uncharacterized membrane protein